MPKVHQHSAGGSSRGRRGRSAFVATSLAEINVVPLVDVMLVLLIIFMVTAPMLQQGLEINLPQSAKSKAVDAQPIYITVPGDFSKTHLVQLGAESIRIEILHERVRQALATKTDKSVFVRADRSASMQDFMTVTDKLKEGGVDMVGVMTQPAVRK